MGGAKPASLKLGQPRANDEMQHFLLLGAGFSRNWGGWLASEVFDYLIGCPEILTNPPLRRALWKTKDAGGFEQTLARIQSDILVPMERDRANHAFELALMRMFADMNEALLEVDDLESPESSAPPGSVAACTS
jgi:hypothetical protein